MSNLFILFFFLFFLSYFFLIFIFFSYIYILSFWVLSLVLSLVFSLVLSSYITFYLIFFVIFFCQNFLSIFLSYIKNSSIIIIYLFSNYDFLQLKISKLFVFYHFTSLKLIYTPETRYRNLIKFSYSITVRHPCYVITYRSGFFFLFFFNHIKVLFRQKFKILTVIFKQIL